MRKVLISLVMVALIAGAVLGGDIAVKREYADFSTATLASNKVSTAVKTSGYVQEIVLVPTGISTQKVEIYISHEGGNMKQYVYTNYTLSAETTVRPRVDATDNAGGDLTGDDPTRYLINGGVLTVDVTNVNKTASSGLAVLIKTEK